MKLAILIPTLVERRIQRNLLCMQLLEQIKNAGADNDAEILWIEDNREKTTGYKRNQLIQYASERNSEYVAFFDDDDEAGLTYIERGLEVVASGKDCGSLVGQIYWSGIPGKPFLHSLEHKEWYEDEKYYYRMPNHLNFVKLDKVKDIKFPDQVFGEDGVWSYAVRDAGVLQTEHKIEDVIYHYYCGFPKHKL